MQTRAKKIPESLIKLLPSGSKALLHLDFCLLCEKVHLLFKPVCAEDYVWLMFHYHFFHYIKIAT